MGIVVATGMGVSTAANSRSADQITGTYQFIPTDGEVAIYARGSATGMKIQLFADGVALCNDLDVPFFGSSGALSKNDHLVATFEVDEGARLEFFLRNSTAGALTMDYSVDFEAD